MQPSICADTLIDRSIDYGAGPVVDSLTKLITQRSCNFCAVLILSDLEIGQPVDISDQMTIEPITNLPQELQSFMGLSSATEHGANPTYRGRSALIHRATRSVQIADVAEDIVTDPQIFNSSGAFRSALNALAAEARFSPIILGHTSYVEDIGWPRQRHSGASWQGKPPTRHVANIADVSSFIALAESNSDNQTIQRAMSKLRDAHSRLNDAERALDLGTCLEIILMHNEQDSSEIQYKLRTRASLLLGTDADERVRIWDLVGKAYGLRSKAAHTGSLPTSTRTAEDHHRTQALLQDTAILCGVLIRKILTDGWPDWKLLVLGATRTDRD